MAHELGDRLDRAIAKARSLAPHELMPRDDDGTPITAARFLSLYAAGGAEDFFSSDLHDIVLEAKLGVFRAPVAFLISGEDEYMPPHVDKAQLLARFVQAAGSHASTHSEVIAGANHSVEDPDAQARFLDIVLAFLDDVTAGDDMHGPFY